MTDENEKLVAKKVKSSNMKFPIAMVKAEEERAWGIAGFPTSYLVDVDGTILWKGHPGAFDKEVGSKLDQWLKRTSSRPALPDKHKKLDKLLVKGDFDKAYTAAKKSLARAGDDDLTGLVTWLEKQVSTRMDEAIACEEKGEFGRAQELYEALADGWAGIPGGEEAPASLATLKKNKDAKADLAAAKKMRSALDTWRGGDLAKALKSFRGIAKKYPDTATGAHAADIADRHSD